MFQGHDWDRNILILSFRHVPFFAHFRAHKNQWLHYHQQSPDTQYFAMLLIVYFFFYFKCLNFMNPCAPRRARIHILYLTIKNNFHVFSTKHLGTLGSKTIPEYFNSKWKVTLFFKKGKRRWFFEWKWKIKWGFINLLRVKTFDFYYKLKYGEKRWDQIPRKHCKMKTAFLTLLKIQPIG
jgi:hypothetical protein